MKKVGLITYHASHNMGSMLQTYAMQYILRERFELEVEIINFSNKKQQELYSLINKERSYKGFIKNVAIFILYPMFKRRFIDFESFIKDYFNLTPEAFERTEELTCIENRYDYLICGSDQIWNVSCTDYDDAYFLSFAGNVKKIAYAPSFGGKNIMDNKSSLNKYRDYLNDFDRLSVREKNGKKWVEELTGKNVEIVADPTILLDCNVWENIVGEREFEGDYIFFYGVPFSAKTYDIVREIGRELNMPVVMLDIKSWVYRCNFFKGFKLSKHSSPKDYLSLIKNSKMVITTSFHGTIFSSIFKKDFWTVTFKETNIEDDRINTLLEQLDLQDRKIFIEDHQKYNLNERVDYSGYEKNINELSAKSLKYLEGSL